MVGASLAQPQSPQDGCADSSEKRQKPRFLVLVSHGSLNRWGMIGDGQALLSGRFRDDRYDRTAKHAVLIGRATDCQIQTQDAQVSRRHARVIFDGSAYWIEDCGSANGVFVNNERVPRYQLRPGTNFRCGYLEVRFEVDGPAASPATATPPAPSPPAPPPIAPPISPPVAVPAPAAPMVVPAAAPAPVVSTSATPSAELIGLRSEMKSERRKRTDLEFELSELKRKLEEQQARPASPTDE